jgi:hypothetical protein
MFLRNFGILKYHGVTSQVILLWFSRSFMLLNSAGLFPMNNIVTHMTIARQRLGKHCPGITLSTIEEYPLLGNGSINTNSRTTEEKCFLWGPCRGIIRGHRRSSEAGSYRSTTEYNGEREREWSVS